ncbi:hypothetical protein I5U65_14800 [Stenotrophomonas maltophilia]|nr:hypothetical protein [Stenotrophomonas maltophilia]
MSVNLREAARKPGRPKKADRDSHQFSIRMRSDLKAKSAEIAFVYGVSLSQAIAMCVERFELPEELKAAAMAMKVARESHASSKGGDK